MSTTLVRYGVTADDTIQTISMLQVGERSKWLDIVALNKLRRPYISNDLADQFGPTLGNLTLQSVMNSGDTTIGNFDTALAGYGSAQSLLATGNVILFSTPGSQGVVIYDIAQISAVITGIDPSSGHTKLTATLTPLSNYNSVTKTMTARVGGMSAHPALSVMQVYGNPAQLSTAVAQTGDYITLPVLTPNQSGNATSASDLIDALGVDIALDQNGQKNVGPNGDVLLVSGPSNVEQALRIRINTAMGELPWHQLYGCELQKYLGATQDASWKSLVFALIQDCILQDSRIVSVGPMTFSQSGDADLITVQIQYNTGGQLLSSNVPISTS